MAQEEDTPDDHQYEVTIRMPVPFESAAYMAGWLESAVRNAMKNQDYVGSPVVMWTNPDGRRMAFHDGDGVWEVKDEQNLQGLPGSTE